MIKKVLIVDDDNYKTEKIKELISNVNNEIKISTEKAINHGLRKIRSEQYDIVILDMSLPQFDTLESSNFNPFGGISFLREMKRRKVTTPVIIVTQYELFGEGNSQKTSEDLNIFCHQNFENYLGIIIYSSSKNEWRGMLVKMLGEL